MGTKAVADGALPGLLAPATNQIFRGNPRFKRFHTKISSRASGDHARFAQVSPRHEDQTTPRPWTAKIGDSGGILTIIRRKLEGEKGYARKEIAFMLGGARESHGDADLTIHARDIFDPSMLCSPAIPQPARMRNASTGCAKSFRCRPDLINGGTDDVCGMRPISVWVPIGLLFSAKAFSPAPRRSCSGRRSSVCEVSSSKVCSVLPAQRLSSGRFYRARPSCAWARPNFTA
jgi:hypothetical protein